MKICKSCTTELPLSEFYKSHKGYYQSECKSCSIRRSTDRNKSNPSKKYEYHKRWRAKHHNKPHIKGQQILDGMVARSKRKGFDRPDFTKAEIVDIIDGGVCCKTGIPFEFDQSKYSKSPWTPVPDRIDSSLGYTKDNVQWVCHMYNSMKQDFSEEDVKTFIQALLNQGDYRPHTETEIDVPAPVV